MGNWSTLNSILWFLPALFSLNVLFFYFNKSNQKVKYIFLALSIFTFLFATQIVNYHYSIPFGLDIAGYIFLLAFLLKQVYSNKDRYININIFYLFVAIIISSGLLFYFEPLKTHSQWHAMVDLAQFSVATTMIGYISFLILNISIFILFLKLKSNNLLSTIGVYSFPIFLLHLIILYKISSFIKFDTVFINIIFLVFCFMFSILFPIVISKLLIKISEKFKYIGMVK